MSSRSAPSDRHAHVAAYTPPLEFGRWQEAAEQGVEVRWYDEVRVDD